MNEKSKPTYSFPENLRYILHSLWCCRKGETALLFLRAPFLVLSPFLALTLSKEVVAAVSAAADPFRILLVITVISLLLLFVITIEKYLSAHLQKFMQIFDISLTTNVLHKCYTCDYDLMESPAGLNRMSKAMENVGSDNRGARLIASVLSSLTANLCGVASYAAMLAFLSPWILLVVTATTLTGFLILKAQASWNHSHKDGWKALDRKLDYLNQTADDFSKAKDIRLYGMGDWFRDLFADALSGRMSWHKREQLYYWKGDWLRALLSFARDGVAYSLLAFLLFERGLPTSDFVLYFGVIGGFAVWLNGVVEDCSRLNRFHLGFCDMREYLEYPDHANHGDGIPLPTETFSVEFQSVCFCYPGSDQEIIHDLNFMLRPGEKLAIVGLNGAGKTTLVKLLCGLYTPSSGRILVNGHSVEEYNREEYFSLFSAVFQDTFLLPLSIAANVSCTIDGGDRERVSRMLDLAGLSEKIRSLPDGLDTKLVRSVYDHAIDLSGGELQKLALARALYKNSLALVLDEPTAALDPIAESRIYEQYNRMTQGHTSVFISHRLASTRFCDRIFFFEKGRIAECGSHEELMALGGEYHALFTVQSQYYREGAMEDAC